MTLKYLILGMGLAGLVGCQSLPESKPAPQPDQEKTIERKTIRTPTGVVIHPYEQEEIQRKKLQVVVPEQKVQQRFEDGRSLPAFKKLMQQTQTAYRQGQWARAEAAALQAQRLAPQSAETYMYLGLVANQKKQPKNAEALARRGLSYAQTPAMKRQLWLIIQKAGQLQNNSRTVQQAQQALKQL